MPRPLPWRLDRAAYPHMQTVQTRFQDMDVLGHINNVAFLSLFETARTKFNHELELWGRKFGGRRAVVASQEIHYLAEGSYPEDVEIATGIGHVGGRSWSILSAMFQEGRAIATCDVVIVMAKGDEGDGMPDAFRARLEEFRVREG
ncbi:MAG TPA: acyl-CoA thioesterase [Sphingomonas sp.]